MFRVFGVLLVVAFVVVLILGSSQQPKALSKQVENPIHVECAFAKGCFGLIEEAIEGATENSTIELGQGTFYEKTLTIDKSMTIKGTGSNRPNASEIVMVDPAPSIKIHARSSAEVVLTSLIIEAQARDVLLERDIGVGIQIIGGQSSLQVTLSDLFIRSHVGIDVAEVQSTEFALTLNESTVIAAEGIRIAGSGEVTIARNNIWGPLGDEKNITILAGNGVSLRSVQGTLSVQIEANEIEGFQFGLWGLGGLTSQSDDLNLTFAENSVFLNSIGGVFIGGNGISAEFNSNFVYRNEGYGMLFGALACDSQTAVGIPFGGSIIGTDNNLTMNSKGSVCPENFTLPDGFLKQ